MLTLREELEQLIFDAGIVLSYSDLAFFCTEACCFILDRYKSIVLDKEALKGDKDCNAKLLHEFNHLESKKLYKIGHKLPFIKSIETKNERLMFRKYIPPEQLESKLQKGLNLFEISEEFCLTEDFITKAYDYYKNKGEITELQISTN